MISFEKYKFRVMLAVRDDNDSEVMREHIIKTLLKFIHRIISPYFPRA